MPQTLHPCAFNFKDVDIRRVGQTTDGGTSLSGISDTIESDGGGYWRADFTNGSTRDKRTGLYWRAVTDALDGGATAVDVLLCERLFQPGDPLPKVPHSDGSPLSDGAEYVSSTNSTATAGAAPLRSTTLPFHGIIAMGGELFSINHPKWGWRAYRALSFGNNGVATIRPPLREAVAEGTPLEFDRPRCRMRLASATSNPTNMGRYTTCALSFVEDMRKPA